MDLRPSVLIDVQKPVSQDTVRLPPVRLSFQCGRIDIAVRLYWWSGTVPVHVGTFDVTSTSTTGQRVLTRTSTTTLHVPVYLRVSWTWFSILLIATYGSNTAECTPAIYIPTAVAVALL